MASISIPVWYTLIPGEDFLFFIEMLSEEHLNDGTGEEAKDKCFLRPCRETARRGRCRQFLWHLVLCKLNIEQ